ncbi:MAG TPA: hypothetical protein VGP93_16810 [Polyangiaceae bacterium]|jgi:hypothetical protein|nr:hypothetical protein [Polyangiaceae bacterium]
MRRRFDEASQRAAERRRREDAAPRLLESVPELESLCLEIQERRDGITNGESVHIRRVVVQHAAALFVLPCHDSTCDSSGHDVTNEIMRALRDGKTHFEGEDPCRGVTGSANCQRVMHYVATATYRR